MLEVKAIEDKTNAHVGVKGNNRMGIKGQVVISKDLRVWLIRVTGNNSTTYLTEQGWQIHMYMSEYAIFELLKGASLIFNP